MNSYGCKPGQLADGLVVGACILLGGAMWLARLAVEVMW